MNQINTEKREAIEKQENAIKLEQEAARKQKYLDDFLKNPNDALSRLQAAIEKEEWTKATSIAEYYLPTHHPEIVKLYATAKAGLDAEKKLPPPPKPSSSNLIMKEPSNACSSMVRVGLVTNGWNNRYENSYGCSSPYKDIGNGYPMPNNLAFYAEGTKSEVRKIKLVLNFNDRNDTDDAYSELLKASALLIKSFTGSDMPVQIKTAILSNSNFTTTLNNTTASVEKVDWPSGGYEIQITIK